MPATDGYAVRTKDDIRRALIKSAGLPGDAAVGAVMSSGHDVSGDRSNRLIWVTAMTTDIDSDQEVVVASGAIPESRFFAKGQGRVFVDHKYDTDHYVGQRRKVFPTFGPGGDSNGWRCQFHCLPLKKNEYADDVLTIAEHQALSVSIGLQGIDFGKTTNAEKLKYKQGSSVPVSIVRVWNWLELSTTLMPANIKCTQVGGGEALVMSEDGYKRLGIIDDLLCKGAVKRKTLEQMGFFEFTKSRVKTPRATQLHERRNRGIILIDG